MGVEDSFKQFGKAGISLCKTLKTPFKPEKTKGIILSVFDSGGVLKLGCEVLKDQREVEVVV